MFTTEVVEKINTYILCTITFLWKSYRLRDVEKFGKARQAINVNIIRRMRFAYWITEGADTHSEHATQFSGHHRPVVSQSVISKYSPHKDDCVCVDCIYQWYVILTDFPLQQWLREYLNITLIRTLPFLFSVMTYSHFVYSYIITRSKLKWWGLPFEDSKM